MQSMIEEKKCPKCGRKEKVKDGFIDEENSGINAKITDVTILEVHFICKAYNKVKNTPDN